MAWIRQLDSGLWAATVRYGPGPNDRITESDPSKALIAGWAKEQEVAIRRGDWIDPRLGQVTVAEWWPRAHAGRGHLELASSKRDESIWRNHVKPYWASTRLSSILKPDVNAWVTQMRTSHKDGCKDRRCKGCRVGAHTIHAAVHVLRSLLEVAVDSRVLHVNHARNVRVPRLPAHLDRVFEPDEERQLLDRLDELFPDRLDARLFVELMFDSGVRWEEAAAITRDVWDMRRARFVVAAVLESDGSLRPYAKSDAGNRPCAVSAALWARLRPVVMATPPGEVVFRAPGKAHLDDCRQRKKCPGCKVPRLHYSNWHDRVWSRALQLEEVLPPAPRPPGKPGPMPRLVRRVPYLADPQPTPHDIRHTYGTRLADQGVPKHDISELMGHADGRSTDRYVHSGDGRFDKALAALDRARRGA